MGRNKEMFLTMCLIKVVSQELRQLLSATASSSQLGTESKHLNHFVSHKQADTVLKVHLVSQRKTQALLHVVTSQDTALNNCDLKDFT